MLHPVFEHVELQLPDDAQNGLFDGPGRAEHLHRAFLRQLRKPLLILLVLHGVFHRQFGEHFRRKDGQFLEHHVPPLAQAVSQPEHARIEQTDDVPGVRLFHDFPILRQKLLRLRQLDLPARPHMADGHASLEPSRTNAQKRDPVSVLRVHVGLDFENVPRKLSVRRLHRPIRAFPGSRRGRQAQEVFQKRPHAEVVDGAAEKDRRQLSGQHLRMIEGIAGNVQQFQFLRQLLRQFFAGHFAERRIIAALDGQHANAAPFAFLVELHPLLHAVVHAAQRTSHADGPVHRHRTDPEHALDLFQEVQRRPPLPVQLVDERENGNAASPAHLKQLDRLGLDTLGAVDEHHRAVGRRQGAVRVFAEILVARRVEDVDAIPDVFEMHHR